MFFYPFLAFGGMKDDKVVIEKSDAIVSILQKSKNDSVAKPPKTKIQEVYGKAPLYFIQNNGQMNEKVKFYEKGGSHTTFFTSEGVYMALFKGHKAKDETPFSVDILNSQSQADKPQAEFIKLIPLDANKNSKIIAEGLYKGKINSFIGKDPKQWKTDIPIYTAVVYKEIYKGIDIKFYGNNQQLEYDIIIKPGADLSKVRFSYEGIKALQVTKDGDLEIVLKEGKIIQKKPYIYQEIDGKRTLVNGEFKILKPTATLQFASNNFSYGFDIASYDKKHPIVIDPVLVYSTYLGGSDSESGWDIAVDTHGNAYITGYTYSINFPTVPPSYGTQIGGTTDAFVAKIDASGTNLVYSTYIGGGFDDWSWSIAVDNFGNAYVTGQTWSTDFPVVSPIYGTHPPGGYIGFLTKINASGNSLVYSTFLLGCFGFGIAVDSSENVYLTGQAWSPDFPVVSPIYATSAGSTDAFVTKINALGNSIVYSTFLGGSSEDYGHGIAVDSAGNAYITGHTNSIDFPTANPVQGNNAGGLWSYDVFVTKINPTGSSLVYSTYLGGSGDDGSSYFGNDIAADSLGNAYVTGTTWSNDFPLVSPIQGVYGGNADAFATKINPSGSIIFSTYLGGSGEDRGYGIAADIHGNAYVTGFTDSIDFPTASPIQSIYKGGADVFVTKINSAGSSFIYSTYLGGWHGDGGQSIAADSSGNAYITGATSSPDFPTVNPIQGLNQGSADVFIAKIGDARHYLFTTFTAKVEIKLGPLYKDDKFEVKAAFTLDTASDGINPLTEAINFKVATIAITIPAGLIKQDKKERFKFEGVVDAVNVEVVIQPLGGNNFEFKAEGKEVDLSGIVNPVTLELNIGNDGGSTAVIAEFE